MLKPIGSSSMVLTTSDDRGVCIPLSLQSNQGSRIDYLDWSRQGYDQLRVADMVRDVLDSPGAAVRSRVLRLPIV
jgi:hypothetical protein